MQKCKFCGSTVIVPSEMFQRQPMGASILTGRSQKVAEIRDLIAGGQKLMAIKVFRETFGVGLKEAKDAVEAMERGMGVDVTAMKIGLTDPHTRDQALRTVKKAGLAIGGSILGTTLLIIIVIVCLIGGIFYFTFTSINRSIDRSLGRPTTGQTRSTSPVDETLRISGDDTAATFQDVRSVAVDGAGRIYAVDYSGGRVQVFDADGKPIIQWAGSQASSVRDMAVDPTGRVVVLVFNGFAIYDGPTGKLLQKKDNFKAEGIAFATDGRIVTAGREGITIFGPDLQTISEMKDLVVKANAKNGFGKVAVNAAGSIFAFDKQNGDVCKFAADGNFLTRFSTDSGSPAGLAIDPKGRVFVSQGSKILVFEDNGRPVGKFAVARPYGIVFDAGGNLLVASHQLIVRYAVSI